MNNDEKNIKEMVLRQIKSGAARMRPRWHFVLKTALLLAGTAVFALTLIYLASFIFFVLRQTGLLLAPAFGLRGFGVFFASLPWLLILAAVVSMLLLEILVSRYSFAYRRPLIYSLLGIIGFVIFGSLVVGQTGFHHKLFQQAEKRGLPWGGRLYRGYGRPHLRNVHTGVIEEKTETGWRLRNQQNEVLHIIITPATRQAAADELKKGDEVMVLGERAGDTVPAWGIRQFNDQRRGSPPGPRRLPGHEPRPGFKLWP